MADDLLFQAGIEGTDEIAEAAEKIGEAWTEAMAKASQAVKQAGSAFDELEEHTKGFGGDFSKGFSEELSKIGGEAKSAMGELGQAFGEGGEHVLQFAEKTGDALKDMFSAFLKIGPAAEEAGGGFSGLLGAGEALGAALGGLVTAIGAVVVAGVGLAITMAHVAEEMTNLQVSTEDTEEEFTKLENVATQTGVGLEGMVEIANKTRDAFRQMSLQLGNSVDMFNTMADRMEQTQQRMEFARQKMALGPDASPEAKAALQQQEQKLQMQQEQVTQERELQRIQRQARQQIQGASGIQRMFVNPVTVDFHVRGIEDVRRISDALDEARKKAEEISKQPIGQQFEAVLRQGAEAAKQGTAALKEWERGTIEAFGPDKARMIFTNFQAMQSGMETSKQAADDLASKLGELSPAEREALTKLADDLRKLGTDFENFALHVAAVFAPIADAAVQVISAIVEHFNNGLRAIGDAITKVGDLLKGLQELALEVADGFLKLAANVLHLIGAFSSTAEAAAKSLEATRAANEKTVGDLDKQRTESLQSPEEALQSQANQPANQNAQYQEEANLRASQNEAQAAAQSAEAAKRKAEADAQAASAAQRQGDASAAAADPIRRQGEAADQAAAPVRNLGDTANTTSGVLGDLGTAISNAISTISSALEKLPSGGTSRSGMASGGAVRGLGSSTSDSIPAMLSAGEYVVNAAAVSHYGVHTLHAINTRQFATGGLVGFQGGGLAHGAANVSGGSSLHPVTMVMPSGRAVSGFNASPSAVASFSHEAAVRRSTSIGRRSSAEG